MKQLVILYGTVGGVLSFIVLVLKFQRICASIGLYIKLFLQYPNVGNYQYKIVAPESYPNAWIVVGSDYNNSYVSGWHFIAS